MPTVDDLSESNYITKNDVEPPVLATIKCWKLEDVSLQTAEEKTKYVLYFEELDKGLVLNKTNGNRIARVANSADFDDWPGVKVVLYNDPDVEFGGKITGGIRVRAPKNQKQEDEIPF